MLNKPINWANINCDSRKRRLYRELFPEEGLSPKYQGVIEPLLAHPPFFFVIRNVRAYFASDNVIFTTPRPFSEACEVPEYAKMNTL